jgi:4-hydroxy-4-methyl-2-oxoglutarate aldolase
VVVDLFGKLEGGTFRGDNLATAIFAATGNGMVVDGGIRDLEGIFPIDMAAYYRGVHRSAIANVMLTGLNVPIRIGNATVIPGDVVVGDRGGFYFIPPQFIEGIRRIPEKATRQPIAVILSDECLNVL